MIHASFSELRKRLAHYMNRAVDDRAPVLVTRQGHEPVVMLAQSEYEGMLETLHLRSSPENARRLNDSIGALERDEGFEVVWDEETQAYKRP